MISKLNGLVAIVLVLCSASAIATCEESSRSSTGVEEFFVICQAADGPMKYVLTQFISEEVSHGILSFRVGRKGFFCHSDSQDTTCHPSNFGAIPDDDFTSARGFTYRVQSIAGLDPVSRADVSFPRNNRITNDLPCYFAIKGKAITLGINSQDLYGLRDCLILLETELRKR